MGFEWKEHPGESLSQEQMTATARDSFLGLAKRFCFSNNLPIAGQVKQIPGEGLRRLKAKREGNCSRPLTLEQLSSRGVCLRPQCLTVVWAVFSPFRWAQSSELRQRKERAICMASASGTQFLRERRPTTGRPHRRCGPTFSGMPLKLVEFGF